MRRTASRRRSDRPSGWPPGRATNTSWPGLGFSPAELAALAANGVRASFLAEAEKEALLAEIAAVPMSY
jgi:hypothetical protein